MKQRVNRKDPGAYLCRFCGARRDLHDLKDQACPDGSGKHFGFLGANRAGLSFSEEDIDWCADLLGSVMRGDNRRARLLLRGPTARGMMQKIVLARQVLGDKAGT